MARPPALQVLGCDFSSSPSLRKPIVLAHGQMQPGTGLVQLQRLQTFSSLAQWGQWLAQTPDTAWVAGFDLPFGLPRALVQALDWPVQWQACMDYYASLSRPEIRAQFVAFCAARPVGSKFAHRATDGPAGSSPSMKWVNPPVAWMLHAGMPWLRAAGVHLPGLAEGDRQRVALEAYPGMLARAVIGRRSYKSDALAKQTPQRLLARQQLLQGLQHGQAPLGMRLQLSAALAGDLLADGRGDRLDAVLCMLQAAWAAQQQAQGHGCYGLPADMDPLEGAIVAAGLVLGPASIPAAASDAGIVMDSKRRPC